MSELYQLPDGWEWIEFSKVFDNPTSKPYQIHAREYLENGVLPIIDQGKEFIVGYTNSTDKKYINKTHCIIFGDHTRHIKYVDFDFAIGADGTKILKEKDKEKFDLKFLYFQFLSKTIESLGYSRHFKLVKEMFFAIPPLREQQRIVAKLDTLFKKIDKAIALHVKNMEEADGFMASVLNEVFSELEEKYGSQKLSNIVKINSGIALPSIFKDIDKSDGEYEFFKVAQMNNDKRIMKDADLNFTLSQSKEYKIKLFPKGSVLIPKRGGAILTNKKRIMEKDASYDSNIMGLKADTKILSDEFLFKFLDSINLADFVDTSTIPQINNKHIEMMNISVPPQIIQENVVAYLDDLSSKIEHVKKVQKEKMESLKALKASILDSAFRGEL